MSEPIKMTRAEFIEKYGDVSVTLNRYYEYRFHFSAILPSGNTLICTYGYGDPEDIYKFDIEARAAYSVRALHPHSGNVYSNGKAIENFYDY